MTIHTNGHRLLLSRPMKGSSLAISLLAISTVAVAQIGASDEPIHYASEKHFANVRQLTFGGNNAEAYWDFNGEKLIFQSDNKNWTKGCDKFSCLTLNWKQTV